MQNVHFRRYIIRYTVRNHVLLLLSSVTIQLNFRLCIGYTSPNANYEYVYPLIIWVITSHQHSYTHLQTISTFSEHIPQTYSCNLVTMTMYQGQTNRMPPGNLHQAGVIQVTFLLNSNIFPCKNIFGFTF